jgi:hypothetical protein
MDLTFVRSKEQNDDMLTKPLNRVNFEENEHNLVSTRGLTLKDNFIICTKCTTCYNQRGIGDWGACSSSSHCHEQS